MALIPIEVKRDKAGAIIEVVRIINDPVNIENYPAYCHTRITSETIPTKEIIIPESISPAGEVTPEHTAIVFQDAKYLKWEAGALVEKTVAEKADADLAIATKAYNEQLEKVRKQRNEMLNAIDEVPCTVDRWAGFTVEQKEAWIARKQYLRDVTSQPDIFNIDWGVNPE